MISRLRHSPVALLLLIAVLPSGISMQGCEDKCEVQNEYVYYEPVYTSMETIRNSVEVIGEQPVKTTGKIYLMNNWLFVNEPGEGIHVINNLNPEHPQFSKFIKIPGNYDLAIKGNILYADSYIDLVAFDISEIGHIKEVGRLKNVFTNYNSLGFYPMEEGIVTDWAEVKEVYVYESECETANQMPWPGMLYANGIAVDSQAEFSARAAIAPGNGSVSGAGGSMARFTIAHNFLYAIDGPDVQAIDVSTESAPILKSRTTLSWDLETIFPHDENLFIGSQTGMHILDITSPSTPVFISTYSHVRVCDPVVVQDDLAFVTLRSGNLCAGFTNQLEVINIGNLTNPQLLKSYPMTNPHGLGVDGNTLFVCDGDDGLKIYDKSDVSKIDENQLAHYAGINTYDVIPFNDILIMVGADGIYQYDYSNPKDIRFLSHIQVTNEGL